MSGQTPSGSLQRDFSVGELRNSVDDVSLELGVDPVDYEAIVGVWFNVNSEKRSPTKHRRRVDDCEALF